jgi:glucose-6-phosphate 1-epimerase
MKANLERLNKAFGLDGKIKFIEDNNLIKLRVQNQYSQLECFLHGAHITSFKPNEGEELIWLSPLSNYKKGKAIRGGIPICWPWFGKPENSSLQQHGFARNSLFDVHKTSELDNGEIELVLFLRANEESLQIWPYQFSLEVHITIGERLSIELITHNIDTKNFLLTEAIHTYFKVSDISALSLTGLQGATYYDQLLDMESFQSEASLTFISETDRIYKAPDGDINIIQNKGPGIVIEQDHGGAVVVWNPWLEKSASMSDFPNDGYQTMVCVEAANTLYQTINLAPGSRHSIKQTIYCLA